MVTVTSHEYAELIHAYFTGLTSNTSDFIHGLRSTEIVWYDVCFHLARLSGLDGDEDGDAFEALIRDIAKQLDADGWGAIADALEGQLY